MAKKKSGAKAKSTKKRLAHAASATSGVTVINMIPRALSAETGQDSEPMIAVNPNDPNHIVGTAFTRNPMGGTLAPIFISTDGGQTWTLNSIVPAGGSMTGDITVAFSGTDSKLYAGILRADAPGNATRMASLRTNDFAASSQMTILDDRLDPDQPFTQAATVSGGSDNGRERVYVGNNDFAASPQTATLDTFLNAGTNSPSLRKIRLEKRGTVGQDGPQVRPTIHSDGTVYAVYYGWRAASGSFLGNTFRVTSADVVVVRDDNWGKGSSPFEDLQDPGDNLSGLRVIQDISFAFNRQGTPVNGQQRLGGNLSIAVDPRPGMSSTVYLAWNDEPTQGDFTIHVGRSTDRGQTWSSQDLLTISRGTNAALALNSEGEIGLLYQQLTGTGLSRRWSTHFRRSSNGTSWSDLVLSDTPANTPVLSLNPYLGDYAHLVAIGSDFLGIFSANNTPNRANFPNDIIYQRNHNFSTQRLLAIDGVTEVAVSIDPFFFRTTNGGPPPPQEIEINGPEIQGEINPAAESDLYTFRVTTAGTYTIETSGTTDTFLSLFGPDSETTLVAEDDDHGPGTLSLLVQALVVGQYFVRVRHFSSAGTGPYGVSVRSNNNPGPVQIQVDGPEVQGDIGQPGESDLYTFNVANAGEHIIETSGSTDTFLALFGPNSDTTLITQNDDFGSSLLSRIQEPLAVGTYFVRVRHFSPAQTGAYGVRVRRA